jgi:hypothetical protein
MRISIGLKYVHIKFLFLSKNKMWSVQNTKSFVTCRIDDGSLAKNFLLSLIIQPMSVIIIVELDCGSVVVP